MTEASAAQPQRNSFGWDKSNGTKAIFNYLYNVLNTGYN